MNISPVSLSVELDKSSYSVGENVKITVIAQKNNNPAANERIRIAVFRPTGIRAFYAIAHTDKTGIAVAVFQVKKSSPGSYFVEVHNDNGSMGLSSFLVL